MYNMDISIFGFKLNVEILILIGVVYLILIGHTLGGCSNYSLTGGSYALMEGLDNMINADMSNNQTGAASNSNVNMLTQASSSPNLGAAGNMIATKAKEGGGKANGKAGKEGFVGANTNFGESSQYDLTNNSMIDTSSWSKPNMTVVPGQPLSQGVKDFLEREPQQVPLPEGEMLMFANTKFAPEYCPNTYSTSSGCAAMTGDQYNYLKTRGGNNTPYSSY